MLVTMIWSLYIGCMHWSTTLCPIHTCNSYVSVWIKCILKIMLFSWLYHVLHIAESWYDVSLTKCLRISGISDPYLVWKSWGRDPTICAAHCWAINAHQMGAQGLVWTVFLCWWLGVREGMTYPTEFKNSLYYQDIVRFNNPM
jgi:hypothetical protein